MAILRPTSIAYQREPASADWIVAEMETRPHLSGLGVWADGRYFISAQRANAQHVRWAIEAQEALIALVKRGARP
jgi:hypothetical protein